MPQPVFRVHDIAAAKMFKCLPVTDYGKIIQEHKGKQSGARSRRNIKVTKSAGAATKNPTLRKSKPAILEQKDDKNEFSRLKLKSPESR